MRHSRAIVIGAGLVFLGGLAAAQDWPEGPGSAILFAPLDAQEMLAEAQERFMSVAKSCPRCGTPPEHLIWSQYSSLPSTWANLCGRAGWRTKCRFCEQEVDCFVTMKSWTRRQNRRKRSSPMSDKQKGKEPEEREPVYKPMFVKNRPEVVRKLVALLQKPAGGSKPN